MKAKNLARRARRSLSAERSDAWTSSLITASAAALGALAAMAVLNRHLAKKAERENPPAGRFMDVNGVHLHYVERGSGDPIVLLHGNGSMIQDFECSGLIDLAAEDHRVIVFDRPGFGHSGRPRSTIWTPPAQAELLKTALEKLGVSRAVILGHSWGASVAIALALKYPTLARGLVLASGYYYPTPRPDAVASVAPSLPLLGDILSHTLSPLLSRLTWPLTMAKMFGPQPVSRKFKSFPREMALRPSQLRAAAAETVLMVPHALVLRGRYADLKMPIVIIAGEEDRQVDIETQSARLHSDISHSSFRRIGRNGHMIQQTATDEVMSAIREVANGPTRVAAE